MVPDTIPVCATAFDDANPRSATMIAAATQPRLSQANIRETPFANTRIRP
jgi:hypothetical protein